MKKLIALIIIIFLMGMVSACDLTVDITYIDKEKGDYVKCITVKEKNPYNIVHAEIQVFNEEKMLNRAELVVKGKILSEKEIAIEEYVDNKLKHTHYMDVFELDVDKVFGDKKVGVKPGDIITIGNEFCSHFWFDGAIKMEVGKEYILFLLETKDMPTVPFSKYSNYYLAHSIQGIVIINDGMYVFDSAFASFIENAKLVEPESGYLKRYEKAGLEEELKIFLEKEWGKYTSNYEPEPTVEPSAELPGESPAASQETTVRVEFRDPVVEAVARDVLNLQQGDIYEDDLEKVKELVIFSKNINYPQELTKFKTWKNLTLSLMHCSEIKRYWLK
ncbi:MAG: hypothetical protein GX754_04135 [Clostridiaceae bacterium]|nr:hypothetical protein [Clostridiaceae bacterium]